MRIFAVLALLSTSKFLRNGRRQQGFYPVFSTLLYDAIVRW